MVDIDISRLDGFLQIRRLQLAGNIPREFDAEVPVEIPAGKLQPTNSKRRS